MRNVTWIASAQLAKALIAVGSLAILSRLVPPTAFGAFAAVLAVVGIVEIFRDFGLTLAAIQAEKLSAEEQTNLFWANSAIGVGLAGILIVLSTPIAAFYAIPSVAGLTAIVSVTFALNGAAAQYRVRMIRDADFARLSMIEVVAAVAGLGVAIAWASTGAGAAALAVQSVAASAITLVLTMLATRWVPGMPTRQASVKGYVSFGAQLLIVQVVSYLASNIDKVGIAKLYGATVLGYYAKAFTLYLQPLGQLLAPLTNLVVSQLARLRDNPARYLEMLLRVQRATAYVGLGVFGFAFGSAQVLVPALLGRGWAPSIQIFQILCVGGVFQMLGFVYYWMFLSTGRMDVYLRCVFASQPFAVLLVALALPGGTTAVAWAVTVGNIIEWAVPAVWGTKKILGSALEVIVNARAPLLLGLGVGIGAWSGLQFPVASSLISLAWCAAGAFVVSVALVLLAKPLRTDMLAAGGLVLLRLRRS